MHWLHRASPWRCLFEPPFDPEVGEQRLMEPLQRVLSAAPANLSSAYQWQRQWVEVLIRYDLPAWRISQLISDYNAWLYRRAIDESLEEMTSQGWGPVPVRYCVLVLGSGARDESLLGPDQDNALIIEDYPDSRQRDIDGYFQALGEGFTRRLDEAGIPLCQGYVMARWPMWRKRLSEWQTQLELWTQDRQVKRVQQTNILLDFNPVHGDRWLADDLAKSVTQILPTRALFMDEMAALLDELPVALNRRGRLANTSTQEGPFDQAIDLKRQGLMPLVSAVRLLAVHQRCKEVSTRRRLLTLGVAPDCPLSLGEAESVLATFQRLQQLMFDQQRHQMAIGLTTDSWLDLARLRADQVHMLVYDLQAIRRFVNWVQTQVRSSRRVN
ncbi:signal transduction protein [Halomonas sp. TBZ9]|uniref:Signal transduction protein n=1 Tax=Vreelandella azerica TaxID=2732867 RepID=A0A7Y3TVX1_9GAMM|nr:DUF294 nucleotidyltransferase-like domain-containing protein [Halomonas azerica]NOG31055.1 signal transduction protein [Halomonas azerica]